LKRKFRGAQSQNWVVLVYQIHVFVIRSLLKWHPLLYH
jgi:hypothetical protein